MSEFKLFHFFSLVTYFFLLVGKEAVFGNAENSLSPQ